MRHFPIFLDMDRARVVLSGGGEAALAKLRLLLKTRARITLHAEAVRPEIRAFAEAGRITWTTAPLTPSALAGAQLVYAADEDALADAATVEIAKAAGVLWNVVDDLEASAFITPAMVDRAPLTVAIGTEGAAPMLARAVKRHLEEHLPQSTAELTRAARDFRAEAEALPHGLPRRSFWSDWFETAGPAALEENQPLEDALAALLARHLAAEAPEGRITLTFTGSDDPDLLTMKARRALDRADVVIHDAAISPAVLELARREARLVSLARPTEVPPLHQLLILEADVGAHVVYLGAGPLPRGLADHCRRAGLTVDIIPGLPASDAGQLKETA
ncbi:precorrin-2 dehydrogenase [Pseudooceanicola antarcticus]|uniref:precorrin-2 dehydrogenase n=2 Tax=Pseudooceanicola antarcticus TaxID=1247613 RepID=A0A285J420_9RHOB|nr:NAD(P)-dependent oxidoreductase [Pseudooceanicola antarcticus]PJE29844.1 siroheme synthase [Pseudooceanicola antarcticus]SNY54116.1 precorrin-2 dehydrogenase [Pseudooceanicola antarcticus]